jgi:hypothetical protein
MRIVVANRCNIRLKLVSALIVVGLLIAPPVSAATNATSPLQGGITISPSQKEITLSSGLLVASTTVTLSNNTAAGIVGTVKILDFKTLDDTGGLLFSQAGVSLAKYGLANWMSLPNGTTINVLSGKSVDIPVHIDNRADLSPGGHYGAVVVTLGAPPATGAINKATFKQELVSLLFIKKLGGEIYSLQLQSLVADNQNHMPSTVTTRFKNSGNVHVVPRGYVTVTDNSSKLLAKGTINPDSTLVLPGATRQLATTLQPIATSHHTGHYKVTAYYRYDDQQSFTKSSIFTEGGENNHLVIWLSIAGALLVVAAFILFRRHSRKASRKR